MPIHSTAKKESEEKEKKEKKTEEINKNNKDIPGKKNSRGKQNQSLEKI